MRHGDPQIAGRVRMRDGVEIAYRACGAGRPVLLVHGFLSDSLANWFETGLADALADAGRRVIAPDLRGHGASDAPVEARFWPVDVLVSDLLALVEALGLGDPDLVGYSLGSRTVARMMVRGLRPDRAVLGGLGDTGVMEAGPRADFFRAALRPDGPWPDGAEGLQAIVSRRGLDPQAMNGVLDSFAPTSPAELGSVRAACRIVMGDQDFDNGSAHGLAALIPGATAALVPGDHVGAVSSPQLKSEILYFLSGASSSRA